MGGSSIGLMICRHHLVNVPWQKFRSVQTCHSKAEALTARDVFWRRILTFLGRVLCGPMALDENPNTLAGKQIPANKNTRTPFRKKHVGYSG